jgi:hypothetical protein
VTPEDVAAAVQAEADALDLVVGPVVRDGDWVKVYLSAAHASGGTAIIESNGVERFSLHMEEFHWPEFAFEEQDQHQVIRDLARLAATHLFGHTRVRTERRRWRSDRVGLEVQWEGRTYLVTKGGIKPISVDTE